MSLLMRHAVGLAEERRSPESMASAFDSALGGTVAEPCRYTEESIAGQTLGLLTVRPAVGVDPAVLAGSAGQLVWRRRGAGGRLAAVVVDCVGESGTVRRFQVPAPDNPDGGTALREVSSTPDRR
jgi:hypothetical protein